MNASGGGRTKNCERKYDCRCFACYGNMAGCEIFAWGMLPL
jgi:hypothetical protein